MRRALSTEKTALLSGAFRIIAALPQTKKCVQRLKMDHGEEIQTDVASDTPHKKDGTQEADARSRSPAAAAAGANAPAAAAGARHTGPRCFDGTLDMRCTQNQGYNKNSD